MSENDLYKKEIENLRHIYNICVELLSFDRQEKQNKEKLKKLGIEVIDKKNYNRIRTIERRVRKSQITTTSKEELELLVSKETGLDINNPELRKYISKLNKIGYKKYMLECIETIKEYELRLKNKSKKHSIPKQPLKGIIKSHIRNSNPYIEPREIEEIKEQFGIELFDSKEGYFSNDTIDKLFTLRIVNDILSRHEEVGLKSIVDAIDAIYELAIMDKNTSQFIPVIGRRGIEKYQNALDSIKEIQNKDYVKEYAKLYSRIRRYYRTFSREERQDFAEYLLNSKHSYDKLLTPEEFSEQVSNVKKEAPKVYQK